MYDYCSDCGTDFISPRQLKEHYAQSSNHDYCKFCDVHFSNNYKLERHRDSEHFICTPCGRSFRNANGLHEHHRQSPLHSSRYCVSCRRLFQSESHLKNHMNSSLHRTKDFACPGKGCGHLCVSQSALFLHLEAGSCSSGFNRSTVNKFVRQYDTTNIITDPARLITGGSQDEVTYYATRAAWNGVAYECYICHHEYQSLKALNQHLASPKHENKFYICHLSSCQTRFSTLSALWQHIESDKCGVLKFKVVKNAMNRLVGGMKRITIA